jgi:PAS domain S-box-containing protein
MKESLFSDEIRRLLELAAVQTQVIALVITDRSNRIVAWLAGSERIFGYAAEEMLGKSTHCLFTAQDIQAGMPELEVQAAIRTGQGEDDRWMVRKDGVRIWVAGVLTVLRDEQGDVVGFAKVMQNRTDLKAQIEATEARLTASQGVDERKNHFVTTLAHELRSPLASVSQAADLLSGGNVTNLPFALSVIQRQVLFMRKLIDDLLDVTRFATGKLQLQLQPVNLIEILQAAVETSRAAVDQRRQNLQLILPASAVMVPGDATRLQQVFVNLIDNAAKYSQPGGHIWVKLYLEGEDAVVRVEDDGIGIAPDMLPRIFDLFTQAEEVSETGGLGIGLAVVKNVVALHNGVVQVRSDGLGKGSEFTVRLPM